MNLKVRPLALIGAALATIAAAPPQSGSVARSMAESAETPADRLGQALRQIGMTGCAATVQRAAGFLFDGGEAKFVVQPLGPDPNRWPTVIVIESAHRAPGPTRLTTLTVAPGPGGCPGFYEQVIHWAQSCAELKRTVFAEFGAQKPLLRAVTTSELNPAVQLYLLPAGTGCTSVKKELFR